MNGFRIAAVAQAGRGREGTRLGLRGLAQLGGVRWLITVCGHGCIGRLARPICGLA
jgi:hypothetical protein